MSDQNSSTVPPTLHEIDAVLLRLGVKRSTLFDLLKSGQLRSVKLGQRRLIPESAIVDFIADLERQASK
jgi:excisionase family DNA binding protein